LVKAERLGLIDSLAEIDFIAAKSRLSRDFNCIAPQVHEDHELKIEEGRHLLLERNLAASRERAQALILAGKVLVQRCHRGVRLALKNNGTRQRM